MDLTKIHYENGCEFIMKGNFTFSDNPVFREIINYIRDAENTQITVNLTGVDFVDSAAIGMLLLARDESDNFNKVFSLKGLSGQPRKMFEISKLREIFNIV